MKKKQRILIVDNEAEALEAMEDFCRSLGCETEIARDGFEALAKMKLDIDLVLLDVKMPGMDGYDVARRIRENPEFLDVPIAMVTILGNKQDRLRAVEAGANDFISKPVDFVELKVRAASLLKVKEMRDALKRHQLELEDRIRERTETLRQTLHEVVEAQRRTNEAHLDTINRLAVVAEYKDKDTAAHIRRVKEYSTLLAEGLHLPPGEVELISQASPMHDVGKISVPENVLLKPGELDDGEWDLMRRHTLAGGRILSGSPSELLKTGETIAVSHHEKWNGSGYPKGLSEGDIPIAGRICAVADVFDALMSERPYKKAFSKKETFEILREGRGEHFDPRVLDVFFRLRSTILKIREKFKMEVRERMNAF